MHLHAPITHFLQQQTVFTLHSEQTHADAHCSKAGVVPFIIGEPTLFYVMKPVAKHVSLDAPQFQICKGTRMEYLGECWMDIEETLCINEHKESLLTTALREGIEELGLKLSAVSRIFDVGPYEFSSSKSMGKKSMWLYALEMHSTDEVLPMSEVEKSTDARTWLSLPQFEIVGRDDHRYILRSIALKLEAHAHGHSAF